MAKEYPTATSGGGGPLAGKPNSGARSMGKGFGGKPYVNTSANKPAITAEARGFEKTKAGRAEMKTNDIAISRMAKEAKATGTNPSLAEAAAPRSVSPRQKTVPVKNSSNHQPRIGGHAN